VLKTFSITDIGKKRKLNQDYVFASEQPVGNLPNLFVVADGMGGHNAGDLASKVSVTTIVSSIRESKKTDPKELLREAVLEANSIVKKMATEDSSLTGMGTTVVVATFDGHQLLVANVGDSRLYIINEHIKQITIDHSLVEEMVRLGGIDKESARSHPDKNVITRAVGVEDTVQTDFFKADLKLGDVVLMCTDGLTNMLEDVEIQLILENQSDIVEKAQELVKAANNKGGRDNIAVILIEPYINMLEDAGRSL
jgi:protein phosphatase